MSSGWGWFAAWALAGALVVLAFLSAASIGLFVLPFALVALVLVARGSSGGPELLGMVAGAGIVSLLIAVLSGADGAAPWLLVGLGLVTGAIVAYAVARRVAE